jgi:hypothetical protein
MGSHRFAHGKASGHPAGLDRHSEAQASRTDPIAATRCEATSGDGNVLSSASGAEAMPKAKEGLRNEVVLQEVWFALSQQQRHQFGGCFSQMILRAMKHQNPSL